MATDLRAAWAIWAFGTDPSTGNPTGLFRIAPDGASIERVFSCGSPELLYCVERVSLLTTSADGDFYYYFQNDLRLQHRFFRIAAGTKAAVEIGDLSSTKGEHFPNSALGAHSMSVAGDRLHITSRTHYEAGTAYILMFDDGTTAPDVLLELRHRNSKIAASSDGGHLYAHSPGVCDVK